MFSPTIARRAVAGEVVDYYILPENELPLGKVLNQEMCLLAVEFKERDEYGKYFDYITTMDKD